MRNFVNKASPGKIVAIGFLAVLLYSGAYQALIVTWRVGQYRIFEMDKHFSWAESPSGLYRTEIHPEIDNYVLSRDSWKKFKLSFTLANPGRPGFFFHYQDLQNHGFIYLQENANNILLGVRRQGVFEVLQGISQVRFLKEQPCVLEVDETSVKLYLNNKLAGSITVPKSSGPFGFLVAEKDQPTTVFQDIRVQGQLKNGQSVSAQSPSVISPAGVKEKFSLVLFYFALLGLSFYFAFAFTYFASQKEAVSKFFRKFQLNTATAAVIHLILAAWIFWPFFRRGEIFISSYDNFGEIYPLFFFSKHQFSQWLAGNGFPLWNPFFHNGTPFYSSHWNFIYYPLNWPIFFLPDNWVFSALTLKTFLEVFLVGFLAYKFFESELGERSWALFGAIVYQLCSFMIFAFTLFPTASLYFAMTLYLYLLWSMSGRGRKLNFVLLTVAVYLVLTSANVAFVFYAILTLVALTAYRLLTGVQDRSSAWLVGWSALTGFLLSAVRLLPSLWAIAASNRVVENYQTIHDRVFLAIRLFLPEITGWIGPNSFNALLSDNLRLISKGMDLPSNPQNAFFVYFGIIPALFFVASLLLPAQKNFRFWKIYTLIALALCLLIQPFWGVLCILFFPFQHFSYHTIILPVGMAMLAAATGQRLLKGQVPLALVTLARPFFLSVTLAQVYILVFLTYLFPVLTNFTRIVLLTLTLGWAGYFYLKRYFPSLQRRFLAILTGIILGLIWLALLSCTVALITKTLAEKEDLFLGFILPGLQFLAAVALALWGYVCFGASLTRDWFRKKGLVSGIFVLAMVMGWVGSAVLSRVMPLPEMYRLYATDVSLGELKFFIILFVAVLLFILTQRHLLSRRAAVFGLTAVLIFDLLAFQGRFDNISAPSYHRSAFYGRNYFYSKVSTSVRDQMDLLDYRVTGLFQADLNANKGVVFSWPSYGGTLGYLSKRFSAFITNFGFPKDAILIYPEDDHFASQRFLDLSAVRYFFKDPTHFLERPAPLSRLNIFYDFEVGKNDADILKRLAEETFNPQEKVLLASETNPTVVPQPGRPSQRLFIHSAKANEIRAEFRTAVPAVILFVESCDEGWKAFVDGREVAIRQANYNFMAFEVGTGEHFLRLVYAPRKFHLALGISLGGVLLFILFLILWRGTIPLQREEKSK